MVQKLLNRLHPSELATLSQFFIDVAKGILGVPIVVYFISGFSAIVLLVGLVLDLILVILFLSLAFKLARVAKRRNNG